MISLSEQRKLAISKYVIRSLAVINSVTEDIFIDSNKNYPKRTQNIPSIEIEGVGQGGGEWDDEEL